MSLLLLQSFAGAVVAGSAEANSPSLWSAGIEWGTAETTGANGYWQPSVTATPRSGRPAICIAIAGRRIHEQMSSGTWTLGRDDWMSTLAPNTASFTFVGNVAVDLNASIVVALESDTTTEHSDALWIGRVDSVSVTQDTAGAYWTTVSATDIVGVLGEAKAPGTTDYGYDLATLTEYLAAQAGISLSVETADTLPVLNGVTDATQTALAYVNRAERSSNALLFLQGSGRLRAVIRQALAGTVSTIPLTGSDSPADWTEQVSLGNVSNIIELGQDSESLSVNTVPASIALYGERTLTVSDMLTDVWDEWDALIASDALAYPRAVVASADFPVTDLSQQVLFLDPLDWVTHDTDTWQVMSVRHSASPSGWRVSIAADQTQNFLLATTDPEPVDPPVTGTTTITKTYTSTKSATVADSGGGNGAGDYLAVGRYSGVVARSFIQFPIPTDWEDDFPGFIEVVSAEVELRTTTQVWVAFGSSPKWYAHRVTESWSEGTFTDVPGSQYSASNALTWANQPKVTTTGQKVKSHTDAESTDRTVAVTEIAQGWHDHGNHGIRLSAYDESATRHTIEFFSDDHATSGYRPVLRLKCRVTA